MATVRHAFIAEWLDPASSVIWKYQLFYYPETKEVEMVDIKNRRHFLKRTRPSEDIKPELLFVGSTVTVYSRQLKIIDFGDEFTRSRMEAKSERTLAMVKPDAFKHLGKILNAITSSGFHINNLRVCKLSKEEAEGFYAVHQGKPFFATLVQFMSSGRIAAMELVAPAAIQKWRELLGPTDSDQARREAPHSIRAHFGTNKTYNACHGSDAPDTAAQEIRYFFGQAPPVGKCDLGRNTTLGVIKPHSVLDGTAGLMLDCIQETFDITALQLFTLDKIAAAEFYEVYKGVLSPGEFNAMVDELTSGPCLALEVADRDGANPVEQFRELCGPMDPELGRVLRPKSLRAQFGLNRIRNGLHCTDLVEDGPLEVAYFFTILQN
ncbi:nucleoside diphosphate kinase [Haematococcus lacustris]